MAIPRDPYLRGGPLPPPIPVDPNADTERPVDDRDQNPLREAEVNDLVTEPERPLTDEEADAAKADAGRQPRTYAPASERVPKAPAPGDAEIIEEGRDYQPSREAAQHPGDRSAPEEMR